MSSAQGEDAEEEGLPGLRHVEMMELWGRSLRQRLPKVLEPLALWACISPRALSGHCPGAGAAQPAQNVALRCVSVCLGGARAACR